MVTTSQHAILQDLGARIVCIRGPLGPETMDTVIDLLLRLNATKKKKITLNITSVQGGNLSEIAKMADVLSILQSKVKAVGLGIIQGAGAGIFSLCSHRILTPGAILCFNGLEKDSTLPLPSPLGFSTNAKSPKNIDDQLLENIKATGIKGRILATYLTDQFSADPLLLTAKQAVEAKLADQIIRTKHHPLHEQN